MAKKVLVVDDSAVIRQVEETVLAKAGYEVVSANGGKEALVKMETAAFNLILTDLNMPDLDGVSLIKQVRAGGGKHRLTPIVMVTTESKDTKKQEGKSAGATAWMVKPFTPDQLLAVVKRILG
jgi:two-component system chemotaxis response regulator CheY